MRRCTECASCNTLRMVPPIERPKLEGKIAVAPDRNISFAEFGAPQGKAVFWLHGTPGARRQIPPEARAWAALNGIRLVGIDRPGIGVSTPHRYQQVLEFANDLEVVADTLGIDKMAVIGLSGGGPYALSSAAAMPDRVVAVGVLGGVAPTVGPEAIGGGLMALGSLVAPALEVAAAPIGFVATQAVRLIRPFGNTAVELYARVSPEGDRRLLLRPEFKAMFLDDLLNGSRFQTSAPINDLVLFTKAWGFELADVRVPVRWWHGDDDHIVPFRHGAHVVERLPDATMTVIDGESHLGGLSIAQDVIDTLMELGPRRADAVPR